MTVIDYGVGNLYSVQRALEFCGAESVVVSSSPEDIESADRLILPGVGAFSDGMEGLKQRGLIEPIHAAMLPLGNLYGDLSRHANACYAK